MTGIPALWAVSIVLFKPSSEFESRMIASTCWAIIESTAAICFATLVPALLMISFVTFGFTPGISAYAFIAACNSTRAAFP